MRNVRRTVLSLVATLAVVLAGWALATPGDVATSAASEFAAAAAVASTDAGAASGCAATELPAPLTPVGKGKPPKLACCNPALEPGTNGNPFCFEGHTCCTDGTWRCNNPDATPSCDVGEVCAAGCGSRGDSCSSGGDCCSGSCKGGRCK
ncbi:MAG: hypothetical protein OEQ13_06440 [Acidobacteriota bacterium]|nr:hypothetical protein [Acidobacteriota bacterium]